MKVATRKTSRKAAKTMGAASYKFGRADKMRTKGQIMGQIAEKTGLTRKQVVSVFDAMTSMLTQDLKSGPKMFNLVGLAKVTVQHKPATCLLVRRPVLRPHPLRRGHGTHGVPRDLRVA